MSVLKKSCAKCGKSEDNLSACAKCHLVSYCSRECQRSDWPKHKVSCKLDTTATIVSTSGSQHHGVPVTDDEEEATRTVIQQLEYIFDVLTGVEKETAIRGLIEVTKEQRREHRRAKNFFGVAENCLTLCSIYVKLKHFTEAESAINRCVRYVGKVDDMIQDDPVARSNPDLESLRLSMQWNRLVVDTLLLTAANESEMYDVEQMPMGSERCERTYAVVGKLLREQTNCLKIGNLHQCFKIDVHCICIVHAIDNAESGSRDKTRRLLANRMAHAESMILNHGPELDQISVDRVRNFKMMLDMQNLMLSP